MSKPCSALVSPGRKKKTTSHCSFSAGSTFCNVFRRFATRLRICLCCAFFWRNCFLNLLMFSAVCDVFSQVAECYRRKKKRKPSCTPAWRSSINVYVTWLFDVLRDRLKPFWAFASITGRAAVGNCKSAKSFRQTALFFFFYERDQHMESLTRSTRN